MQCNVHLDLGIFCHSSLQIVSSSVRLDGDCRWTAISRSLQRYLIGFKSGWAGPLKDIHRVVPRPLLYCLVCVFRVIFLLEGEPLAQSEVLSALDQVFIKDISVLCSVEFPPDMTHRFEVKQSNLCFIRPENPVSCQYESPLGAFLQIQSGLSCITEERLPSDHSALKPRSVECCCDGCPSGSFSHLHTGSLELSQSDHSGTWSPRLPRPQPDCSVCPGGQL